MRTISPACTATLHGAFADASLAIKPVFDRFQSVILTSGTLSPLDMYPRILNFHPVVSRSLEMSMTRPCICPVVVTKGADQAPISTRFAERDDPTVLINYGCTSGIQVVHRSVTMTSRPRACERPSYACRSLLCDAGWGCVFLHKLLLHGANHQSVGPYAGARATAEA